MKLSSALQTFFSYKCHAEDLAEIHRILKEHSVIMNIKLKCHRYIK